MRKVLLMVSLVVLASGCASVPKKDYTKFNSAAPRSILVIPVTNRSVNVDAPDYFLSTLAVPLAEHGYYVFPVHMVKRILEDDGLSDADLVHSSPTEKLAALFGADAVLYVEIERWDARYILLSTTVTVQLKYVIKEGKTGEVLWEDLRLLQYAPQTSSSGNPLADLLVMAVTAAVEKAAPNYMPLARQANAMTFTYPGPGIPPGPYLKKEEHLDQSQKPVKKATEKKDASAIKI